jgi:hypothetical protein
MRMQTFPKGAQVQPYESAAAFGTPTVSATAVATSAAVDARASLAPSFSGPSAEQRECMVSFLSVGLRLGRRPVTEGANVLPSYECSVKLL